MTFRPFTIALTAATVVAGCGAIAQTVATPAQQDDMSRADYLARAAERFDRMDANRDGRLSRDERRAGRPERGGRGERAMRRGAEERGTRRGPGRPGGPGGPGARIERMDLNNDGRVSRQEAIQHATDRATRMFDRLDRNRDGFIDAGERPQHGGPDAARAADDEM